MRYILFFIIFNTTLLLNGCAPVHTAHEDLAQQSPSSFALSGAIAAKNQHHGWIATFYWTQRGRNDYQILLNGPLGSNNIDLTMHQGTLTYREGNKIIHSQHPEELLAKETGIRIPVGYLYDWIRGKAAPVHIDAITRSTEQDILLLKQAGFVITYSDYQHHYPHKIRLEGHQLTLKIVIKNWISH